MPSLSGTVQVETARLILRRFRPEDARDMFENWARDPVVSEFLSWEAHRNVCETEAILAQWIQDYDQPCKYNWAIVWKESDAVIGSIATVQFSQTHACCEIGYCIGRTYWGRGVMSEALRAVIDFLFVHAGVNRIQAQHDVANPASGRVMEKNGMKLEGTLRQCRRRRDGSFGDGKIWSILREEHFSSTQSKDAAGSA